MDEYSRPGRADTGAYAKSQVVHAGNGKLKTLRAHNNGSGDIFLQLFDAAALPANGVAPSTAPVPVKAGQYYESDTPFNFFAGLVVVASTTAATKTLVSGNDVWITAEFKY
jgi:hypothetical protein